MGGDFTQFAERVERLCEFLLSRTEDEQDARALNGLKNEAADYATRRKRPEPPATEGIWEVLK